MTTTTDEAYKIALAAFACTDMPERLSYRLVNDVPSISWGVVQARAERVARKDYENSDLYDPNDDDPDFWHLFGQGGEGEVAIHLRLALAGRGRDRKGQQEQHYA